MPKTNKSRKGAPKKEESDDEETRGFKVFSKEEFKELVDPETYNPAEFNLFNNNKPPIMVKDHHGVHVPVLPINQQFICPFCFYRDCMNEAFTETHSYKYNSLAQSSHHKSFPKNAQSQHCIVARAKWLQEMFNKGKHHGIPASFAKEVWLGTNHGIVDGMKVLSDEAYAAYESGVRTFDLHGLPKFCCVNYFHVVD